MKNNWKIFIILLIDGISVLINDFFHVYITLYTMNYLSVHDLAMCGLIGSVINVIVNQLLKNNNFIDNLIKYYVYIGMLITIIYSCNIFLLKYNVLIFFIVNTFVFTGLNPLQFVIVDDVLNNVFSKRERTMFNIRRKWVFAIAALLASIVTMIIDDLFVLIDNICFVFILFIVCGLSDIYTIKLCKNLK